MNQNCGADTKTDTQTSGTELGAYRSIHAYIVKKYLTKEPRMLNKTESSISDTGKTGYSHVK